MSRAAQRLRRVFERRYLSALIILALTSTVAFATSFRMTMIESDRARAVILATEQRALSQRVAFLIKEIDRTADPVRVSEVRSELDITIARMRYAHDVLSAHDTSEQNVQRFVAPLGPIYFGGVVPFDVRVRQFLENAQIISATSPFSAEWSLTKPLRDEIVSSASSTLMQTHGLMVLILEAEARQDVRLSKIVDIVTWLSIIAVLVLVTFIIFIPMKNEIYQAFKGLEDEKSRADKAEERAVDANNARGSFFQAASHELRTPLNAILGMSDVIKSKEIQEIETEIEQITAAGDHLLVLLNNILDAHKIGQGDVKTESKPFPIAETFDRVEALAMQLAEQKGLEYKSDIELPEGLQVLGDAGRLEQVLVNVVNNAAKFTEEGSINVHAHVDEENAQKAHLHVAVADTGAGISAEKIQEIFDRRTSDAGAFARNGGLGLGLAVTRDIVELMGGAIEVESVEGEGTKVLINLPFDVDEESMAVLAAAPSMETSPEPAASTSVTRRREFNALIVDDNMANRMVAEALLKPLGALSEMAVDGRQAVAKAEDAHFDIIFMDISMPVMDGIEATEAIRAGTGLSQGTPIVALTAHVDYSEFDALKEKGFQDIITKPVRKETLVRCLDRWLDLEDDAEHEEVA